MSTSTPSLNQEAHVGTGGPPTLPVEGGDGQSRHRECWDLPIRSCLWLRPTSHPRYPAWQSGFLPPDGWRGWDGCSLPVPSVTSVPSRAWASWAPRKDRCDVGSKAHRLLRATEPWCDLLQRWQLPDWPEVCPSARSSQGAAS